MSESVGSILGYLKLDRSEWDSEIDAANAKAKELGQSNPNVHISTNSGAAIAQLAAVSAAVKRLQDARGAEAVAQQKLTELQDKDGVSKSRLMKAEQDVEKAHRSTANAVVQLAKAYDTAGNSEGKLSQFAKATKNDMSSLVTVLAALGPALVPIGTVALGAVGAFGALGAAGVLAILGIQREMKNGTALGQQYAQGIGVLKSNLQGLEHSAASGFMAPFNAAIQSSQKYLPGLNAEMTTFGTIAGNVAGHVFTGLLGGLQSLQPMFLTLGAALQRGALAFEAWATGSDGLKKFGATVSSELPQVIGTLGDVATAIGHILTALGPVGGTSLKILSALASVINALPVGVITTLATAFITLRTAALGLNVLSSLSGMLAKIGSSGAAGGIVGVVAATVALSQVLPGLIGHGAQTNEMFKDGAVHAEDFQNALTQANGALTSTVQQGVNASLAGSVLATTWGAAGVSLKDLGAAVTGSDAQWQAFLDTQGKSDGVNKSMVSSLSKVRDEYQQNATQAKKLADANAALDKELAAANPALAAQAKSLGLTITALQTAQTAVDKQKQSDQQALAVKKLLISENYQLDGTQDTLSRAFGITTSQVQQYASMLGITQDMVTQGAVSSGQYADAVDQIADAENNATQTGSAYLAALSTFSQSAGTAADRAALIGATLKAANGDNLNFANAMNGSAVASKNLSDSVAQAASQVGKGGESVKAYMASIVNLKTGVIDYTNAAAAPLIQGLQQEQDAAMSAAQAQYQHEVATKGGKVAADDAYKTYVGQTRGSLIDQASKLGLTRAQAKSLADQYFGMPKDVKTKIEQEGASPIQTVLNSIRDILSAIAKSWGITVDADTSNALANLQNLRNVVDSLANKNINIGASVNGAGQIGIKGGGHYAAGTGAGGVPDGFFTVGERGYELGYKRGSDVQIFSHDKSVQMTGMSQVPGFASGTQSQTAAQRRAAVRRAATVAQQKANIRFTVSTDLPRIFTAIQGSVATLGATLRKVLNDVHTAATKGVGGSSVVDAVNHDNALLLYAADKRDAVVKRLKSAEALLAARQGQFNTEKSNVAQGYAGAFDITAAGGDAADIIASLQGDVNDAKATSALVGKLKGKHLNNTLLEKIASNPNSPNALALQNASSAQVAQINKLYHTLGVTGDAAGAQVASSMYGAGVNAAKGLVAGLKSQESTLEAQMKRLAAVMVNTIKHDLKIHSPSQVGHELGAFFGQGMANGIQTKHVTVSRAASGLANAAVPTMPAPVGPASGATNIRVFIGERELTDIVRVEIDGHTDSLTDQLVYGRQP